MNVEPFKVKCVDDTKITANIPKELHVKEGEVYTADSVVHLLSSPIIGLKLIEKPLGEECFPYHYWGIHRFEPYDESLEEKLEELMDEVQELIKPDVTHGA